jgi:hypothetical protein
MRTFAFVTLAAAGLAAVTLGVVAPALAAPSGPGSAQQTVATLEASGYRVILNRVGAAPLDQCTVTAIRPGQQVTEPRTSSGGNLVEQVIFTTVYVDASC